MRIGKTTKIVLAIALCELVGFAGSFAVTSSVNTWYATLAKPSLAPPNWVFAPVWTTLFALMGIAAGLVWSRGFSRKGVKRALGVFALQLALNAFWSPLFFGLRLPGWAFVDIVCLLITVVVTIVLCARVSKLAAWLLAPYLLWVSFASYVNFMIWFLN